MQRADAPALLLKLLVSAQVSVGNTQRLCGESQPSHVRSMMFGWRFGDSGAQRRPSNTTTQRVRKACMTASCPGANDPVRLGDGAAAVEDGDVAGTVPGSGSKDVPDAASYVLRTHDVVVPKQRVIRINRLAGSDVNTGACDGAVGERRVQRGLVDHPAA